MKLTRKRVTVAAAGGTVVVAACLAPVAFSTSASALNTQPQVYFASVSATGVLAPNRFPAGTTVTKLTTGPGDYRVVLNVPTAGCVSTANTNQDAPQAATAQSAPPGFPTAILVHTFGANNVPADLGFDLITVC